MIKFFRKIRKQLLTENKFNKYLIYVISEIALVIIGILIALSINNWNEKHKLKSIEQTLLKDNSEFRLYTAGLFNNLRKTDNYE